MGIDGGYAQELRFKDARSTMDIDLAVQWVAPSAGDDQNRSVRNMLQSAAMRPSPRGSRDRVEDSRAPAFPESPAISSTP